MSNGLAEFQMQAVARIVERFNDPQGSRRFLLADEVGLGKTRVAAGVIEALRKRKGFIVIYVCSNAEIAEQNRDKLAPGAKAASVTRLSLLALDSKKIKKDLSHGELRIFSFTPGTSFQVRRSTGVVRERRLLLFLLWRVWRMPVGQARWREFFRCTAGIEDWMASTHFKQLCHEFAFQISADLQNELKKAWNSCLVESGPGTGRPHQESQPLADALRSAVEVFYKRPNAIARANRNRIIGTLRECLSKVALQFLKPDLVLLDEFQKFPEILKESQNSETIIGCLFRNRNTPALILSATPYKMYSLNYEDAKHRDELLNTLAFLHGHRAGSNPADAHEVKNIVEKLDAFKAALLGGEWFNKANPDLLKLRKDIENLLKPVMCRTERYWYIADEMKGVKESGDAPDQLPSPGELEQYVRLRQFLLKQKIDDWNITDFWKSAPLPLVFMDGDYALIKRLRHRRFQTVPPQLLPSGPSLTIACRDNLKVQNLVNEVLPAGRQFKYLWVKPAYCYECDREKDDFFADGGPVKMLVFSHWKFVPKAIAVILSHEAEQRIDPPRRRRKEKSPLQFRQIISFTSFDVCYPSPVLAGCVNPAAWAREAGRPLLPEKVNERAEQAVRELLLQPANKIEIRDNVRSAPLWRIVARLESVSADVDIVLLGLASSGLEKGDERSAHYDRHRTRYEAYLEDNEETLAISHKWVRRLAQIALYSPAICLLRSMQSVFGRRKWEQQHWAALLSLGINQMRNYFNKRIVQMVIRSQRMAERSYAAQVLSYCQRAQLQAVLDEYAYVLMESLTAKKTEDLPREFLRHLSTVFGIGSGSPSVNQLTKTGHVKRRPMPRPSHFALAFGDDILVKDKAQMKRSRKTAMREAFNSPFWPFVLATTSVGQEGLDFHLYCRDVMHWNLPSNPVDLEQREGRINRRNSLAIRRNIANDHPFAAISPSQNGSSNLWADLFTKLSSISTGVQRFKHGLYPHWIYQSNTGESSMVHRHLAFYAGSKDVQRYEDLKLGLSLYRLVFGQPRQQDLIDTLRKQHPLAHHADISKRLGRYIINLSPIPKGHAVRVADQKARALATDPQRLAQTLLEVRQLLSRESTSALQQVTAEIQDLLRIASDGTASPETKPIIRIRAIAALLYLLNSYDDMYDFHDGIGYEDDIAKIRQVHASLCAKAASPQPTVASPAP